MRAPDSEQVSRMTTERIAEGILLVMLVHLCCTSQGLVSDGEILLEFKYSLIDRRNSLETWGPPGADPCDGEGGLEKGWAGVSCNNVSGSGLEVSSLVLHSFSLASSDVSVLSKLKNLYKLDLSHNSFSGQPPGLSKLPNLVYLFLGNNQFEGLLADRFPPRLFEIDVQNNFLTGEIRTTNLFQLPLKRLDLHGNNFQGELPDMSSSGLRTLTYLDVSGNQFEGPLPSGLTKLDLLYCNMSGNGFTGKIQVDQEGGWLPRGVLDLSKNRLNGNIPAKLFTSLGMSYLDLSDNELEGPVPNEVSEEVKAEMEYLYLQNNRLTGDVYDVLRSNFSTLVELRLQGNAKSAGGGFTIPGANQAFKLITCSSPSVGNKCGSCFGRSSSDFLNYSETFPPSAVNRTVHHPRLRVLDLSDSNLEGSIPSDIFNPQSLPSLRILDLSGNSLNGTIPAGLMRMPGLRELRLGGNSLIGHIENWVDSNWTNLEVLDIRDNCLWFNTSRTIEDMLEFPRLRELRLGRNPVSSGISLPTLVGLDGSLEALRLEVLDLSWLSMHGYISFSYSSRKVFPSLKYLDLSRNLLDGPVPGGYRNMSGLTHLDLSFNSLSGEIPPLPPVLLNSDFFIGNVWLCGPPLVRCLSNWTILVIVLVLSVANILSVYRLLEIWDRRADAKKRKQDSEVIAALLDKDTMTLMSLEELSEATDYFSDEAIIGKGGFGTVYRGVLDDGTEVAIKKSKSEGSTSVSNPKDLLLRKVDLRLRKLKLLSPHYRRRLVRFMSWSLGIRFDQICIKIISRIRNSMILKSKRDRSTSGNRSTSEDKSKMLNWEEVKILSQVHHRNLVRLFGCCLANETAMLVFEFVPNGTLEGSLHPEHGQTPLTPLTWNQRLIIAIQTANALDYLHTFAMPPIYHLDVKSANILLDEKLNAKVADFGISKLVLDATPIPNDTGTLGYIDPEMMQTNIATEKADVYAFAVVLLELLTARPALDRSKYSEDRSLVMWAGRMIRDGKLEDVIDPFIKGVFDTADGKKSIDAVAGLAMKCLLSQSEHRPTMKEACRVLESIEQGTPPVSSRWTPTTRNEETLSSIQVYTV